MQKTVVFFDICSSSRIIEDLSLGENTTRIRRWEKLLAALQKKLTDASGASGFEVYKFVGDGWIILFDPASEPAGQLAFFASLCSFYEQTFSELIDEQLQTVIGIHGLTFGLDSGDIYPIDLKGGREYIGSPLNIASRLQSAIRNPQDPSDNPADQLLMPRPLFNDRYREAVGKQYETSTVKRTLRNIRNDSTMYCTRIKLRTAGT
ncbi:MAG TPA: hypothetical protein VMW73_12600 [Spirochaetia bacterium]|nr:hypothetical protein [Spirochaetia bacterium]